MSRPQPPPAEPPPPLPKEEPKPEPEPRHENKIADRQEPKLIGGVPRLRISGSVDTGSLRSTTIVIAFVVDERGHPTRIRVKQSSGNSDYDQAAVSAVSRARFLPAVQNGEPRDAPWEMRFRIN